MVFSLQRGGLMGETNVFKSTSKIKRIILFQFFRILLIISLAIEIETGRWAILIVNLLVLFLTFLPFIMEKTFSISLPLKFDILFLTCLVSAVFLEKLLSGVVLQVFFGMSLGVIGFILMFLLYSNSRIKTSYVFIALFSFCFSVSLGAIWEVFRYFLQVFFNLEIGNFSINYTVWSLVFTMIGALIASTSGFLYIKYKKNGALHRLAAAFMRARPKLFSDYDNSPDYIQDLIKNGESEALEFKSTLRTNLHTKKTDKKMEHAVMKSITSFLNTDGGTLLVGVLDNGNISGIEQDVFSDNDNFYRHFTNLVKDHIGPEYLPYIKSKIIPVEDRTVLKVDCSSSDKEVFLKTDKLEEFYVRAGASSVRLEGSKLIDYVNQKFEKN